MKNTIILKAEGELEDKVCREMMQKLITQVETINERTKAHTIQLRELNKKIK